MKAAAAATESFLVSSCCCTKTAAVTCFSTGSPLARLHALSSPFSLTSLKGHRTTNRHRSFLKKPIRSAVSASSMADEARVPPTLPLPTPPITNFKIALCQLSVTADKEKNIAHARNAVQEAVQKGAKLVLLPEIWNSPYSNNSFPLYAEDIDAGGDASPSTAMLSELARSLQITIVGGSLPELSGDKLYNTCCVFDTDGKIKAKHRKVLHLLTDSLFKGRYWF